MREGAIVHDTIREILIATASDHPINLEQLIACAQSSFDATARWACKHPIHQINPLRPKFICDEKGEHLSDEEIAAYKESIARKIHVFMANPHVRDLLAQPAEILPSFVDAADFGITREIGVPACMRIDALTVRDGAYTIWDWKTGLKHESHRDTALAYDLHVRKKLRLVTSTSVSVRFLFLGSGDIEDFTFTTDERADKAWQIYTEYEDLLHEDLRAARGEAAFPARVTRACEACQFQFVCTAYKSRGGAK